MLIEFYRLQSWMVYLCLSFAPKPPDSRAPGLNVQYVWGLRQSIRPLKLVILRGCQRGCMEPINIWLPSMTVIGQNAQWFSPWISYCPRPTLGKCTPSIFFPRAIWVKVLEICFVSSSRYQARKKTHKTVFMNFIRHRQNEKLLSAGCELICITNRDSR